MTDKEKLERFFLDRISEQSADGEDHVFSPEYDRKRQRIIRRASRGGGRVRYSRLVIAAAAAAACGLIFAGVRVFRVPGFAGVQHSGSTRFSVEPSEDSQASGMEYYGVDIPDGMTLESVSVVPEVSTFFSWSDDSRYLVFTQNISSSFNPSIDNEHSEYVECTVDGHNGFMVKWDHGAMLMWDIGGSVLGLNGSGFTDDELMKVAAGARPIEGFTLEFDSTGAEFREHPFSLEGFSVAGRSQSGGVTETLLTGCRDLRVRQCAPEDYSPLQDLDCFEMTRVTVCDVDCWLVRWINDDMYAVVWEQDGCVTEMSTPSDPPQIDGVFDISADEESILSLAGKLMDSILAENG